MTNDEIAVKTHTIKYCNSNFFGIKSEYNKTNKIKNCTTILLNMIRIMLRAEKKWESGSGASRLLLLFMSAKLV